MRDEAIENLYKQIYRLEQMEFERGIFWEGHKYYG